MSTFSSPAISSTRPTSLPSEASTFQPGSIITHATGSDISDGLAADVPDGPLRADRFRVGEHAQCVQLAGDAGFVEPLEAAARHPRGRAVAEAARDAEAQRRLA